MEVRKIRLLTAQECADRLNISRAGLSRLVAKGSIGFYRIGFKTMFSEAHLAAYLNSVEGNQVNTHSPHHSSRGEANGTV
jgi:excisionase family DNA binding protein